MLAAAALALSLPVFGAATAAADTLAAPAPVTPSTADEARQAWVDASRRSEQFGERVLQAQGTVDRTKLAAVAATTRMVTADKLVAAAQVKVDAAQRGVDAAAGKVAAADAVVAKYRSRVDAFANASFRGARLSSMTLLLTASTPDDYLDTATTIDRIAADTQATLDGAKTARVTAAQARADAESARGVAQAARTETDTARAGVAAAKKTADLAAARAVTARKGLDAERVALTAEIASYQVAYARLSAGDRRAAVSDAESANMSSAAQARMADQAAQRKSAGIEPDTSINYATPEGTAQAGREAPDLTTAIAVEAALSRQGLPYVWAATGPNEFDCSGLMLWAWAQAGVTIPRTSAEQSTLQDVPLDQLEPGDLVTFYSPVSHVGMYVGHGMVLHASMPGVPIKVVPLDAAGPNPSGHRVQH